ncbi:MAG: hypothetical protein ACM33T_16855 [Solirubrobacterales bacterium]
MFAKLLLTVVVVALIYFGFKYLSRMAEIRARHEARGRRQASGPSFRDTLAATEAKDLVKCPVCGTWRSGGSCGRSDCPY